MIGSVSGDSRSGASLLSTVFLFTTILLIALGTFLPQKAPPGMYAAVFGPAAARIIAVAGIDDIYRSWPFLVSAALLAAAMLRRVRPGQMSFPALTVLLGAGRILFGAVYGRAAGWEGFLPLTVGETKDIVVTRDGFCRLPFSVQLDEFVVEEEQGSPSGFRSTFTLRTGDAVLSRGSAEVNRPFRYAGSSFYQQAYDPARPRWTALKVASDPGLKFVFPGLFLFNAGIIGCIVIHARRTKKETGG